MNSCGNADCGWLQFITNDNGDFWMSQIGCLNTCCRFGITTGGCVCITCNLAISGSLSKSSGCFRISHPDPVKQEKYDLVHSFVESPTSGDNIYRWSTDTTNCRSVIELPDYYRHLNKNDQVWVSPDRHFGNAYGEVTEDQKCLIVCSQSDGSYNVLLIGTRKDDAVRSWSGPEIPTSRNIVSMKEDDCPCGSTKHT